MTKPRILLIGAGGHARACIDVIEAHGGYEIAGLTDSDATIQSCQGYPILGADKDLVSLSRQIKFALVAVGQILTPDTRIRLFNQAAAAGFRFPIIISPRAYVSKKTKIADGTIVMHGAIVNANSSVGKNCILNSRSLIEHDVTVGDHCHISTSAVINGGVRVGVGAFLGSGCITREHIVIGAGCVIGMGQTVLRDLIDNEEFLGCH